MNAIDRFLNGVTMYRLVLYVLGILAVLALLLAVLGTIPYTAPSLLLSFALLLFVCFVSDGIFARLYDRERNPESSLITALILFLILAPPTGLTDALWLVFGAFIGIASKYLVSYRRKHLFNPAAFSALVLTLLGSGMATWWVATPALFPAMLVLGIFIVRKLRRFDLWIAFMSAALLSKIVVGFVAATGASLDLFVWIVSWPTLFFSTVMLTEPLTMPARRPARVIYGLGTGLLFSIPFALFGVYSTPQLALVIGNIYTFLAGPRGRVRLRLVGAHQQSESVVEFAFKPERPVSFTAGQYAEWTLPHDHPDDRGVRRYFTFSSSPEDPFVRLAVRVGKDMSTFKKTLLALSVGKSISISNISGDFTLPEEGHEKLIFIAGGVGITPFMSMIRSLVAQGTARDIVLVYVANQRSDFAYAEELHNAEANGVRTIYVPGSAPDGWTGPSGTPTAETLVRLVPDVRDRRTYVSGPDAMVRYYTGELQVAGVSSVHTDYFPGL